MLKTQEAIQAWLDERSIEDYTINEDLTVDIDNHLILSNCSLDFIPFQFGSVNGDVDISSNYLSSLRGAPLEINGDFICIENGLTSFEYCPKKINGSIYAQKNPINKIILEHFPEDFFGQIFILDDSTQEQIPIFKPYYKKDNLLCLSLSDIKSIYLQEKLTHNLNYELKNIKKQKI